MDDFAKFQQHQIADDKIVINFGLYFEFVSYRFSGPFDYVFVLSDFSPLDLHYLVVL